jgi:hypothetical protein
MIENFARPNSHLQRSAGRLASSTRVIFARVNPIGSYDGQTNSIARPTVMAVTANPSRDNQDEPSAMLDKSGCRIARHRPAWSMGTEGSTNGG